MNLSIRTLPEDDDIRAIDDAAESQAQGLVPEVDPIDLAENNPLEQQVRAETQVKETNAQLIMLQQRAAQAQEDDPRRWTVEKTQQYFKDNPARSIEEEGARNYFLNQKKAEVKSVEERIKKLQAAEMLQRYVQPGMYEDIGLPKRVPTEQEQAKFKKTFLKTNGVTEDVIGDFARAHPLFPVFAVTMPAFEAASLALSMLPRFSQTKAGKEILAKLPEETKTEVESVGYMQGLVPWLNKEGKVEFKNEPKKDVAQVMDAVQILGELLVSGKIESVASRALVEDAVKTVGGELARKGYGTGQITIPQEAIDKIGGITPSGEALLQAINARKIRVPMNPLKPEYEKISRGVKAGSKILNEKGEAIIPKAGDWVTAKQQVGRLVSIDKEKAVIEVAGRALELASSEVQAYTPNTYRAQDVDTKETEKFMRKELEQVNVDRPISEKEKAAQDYFIDHPKEAVNRYLDEVKKEYKTTSENIISADTAKFVAPGMDVLSSGEHHEPGSAFTKYWFEYLLTDERSRAKDVVFTAGVSGAGKTHALRELTQGNYGDYAAIYDTNLNNLESFEKKLKIIDEYNGWIDADRQAEIVFIDRDPVEAYRQTLERATRQDRAVPIDAHVSNANAPAVIQQIRKKYPKVKIVAFKNEGNKLSPLPLDDVKPMRYNKDELKQLLLQEAKDAYDKGIISKEIYDATTGQTGHQRTVPAGYRPGAARPGNINEEDRAILPQESATKVQQLELPLQEKTQKLKPEVEQKEALAGVKKPVISIADVQRYQAAYGRTGGAQVSGYYYQTGKYTATVGRFVDQHGSTNMYVDKSGNIQGLIDTAPDYFDPSAFKNFIFDSEAEAQKAIEKTGYNERVYTPFETKMEVARLNKPVQKEKRLVVDGKVQTVSGRMIDAPPNIRLDSSRKAANDMKALDQWLIDQYAEEAKARRDEWAQIIFKGRVAGKLTPADKDQANEYLFGETDPLFYLNPSEVKKPAAVSQKKLETGYDVERFIKDALADRNKEVASLTKKAAAARGEGKEEIAQIYEGQARDYMSVDADAFSQHVRENPRYYIDSNIDPFLKFKNKEVNLAKPSSQKKKVEQAVAGGPKSIKQVAEETNILEPNIRRILGVGEKDGVFERVDRGVYRLRKDGRDLAYIHPGDAVEILPKLAAKGFKADMVFLDIPYNTVAVRGGNRGVKYDLISPAQFQTVVNALVKIVRDDASPIIYMYSQAKSGLADMKKYTDVLLNKGFKPVARGEYTKLQKDGLTRVRNMLGEIIEPEGILILNKSGEFDPKDNPDLNFKLIRPRGYQTEKPAEMLSKLIKMTTEEGEVVLDPFAGSGVTVAEAVKAGRFGVGIEKSDKAIEEHIKPKLEKVAGESEVYDTKDVRKRVFAPMTGGNPTPRWSAQVTHRGWAIAEKFFDTQEAAQKWIDSLPLDIDKIQMTPGVMQSYGSFFNKTRVAPTDVKAEEVVEVLPSPAAPVPGEDLKSLFENVDEGHIAGTVEKVFNDLKDVEQARYLLELDDLRKTPEGNLFVAIKKLGGFRPYPDGKLSEEMKEIPFYLKNGKSKNTLDQLVGELSQYGWNFSGEDELRQAIIKQARNPVKKANRGALNAIIRESENNPGMREKIIEGFKGKERKFITSVKKSDITSEEVRKAVKGVYDPIANQTTLDEATRLLQEDLDAATAMVWDRGPLDRVESTIGMVLIRRYDAAGQTAEAVALAEHLAERATESGQGVQALAMFSRLSPNGVLLAAQKTVRAARKNIKQKERLTNFERLSKTLADPDKAKLAEKLGIPYLSEAQAVELTEMAKKVQAMEEGRAKQIAEALLFKRISNLIPRPLSSKIALIQTMAQLLNFKTFVRNLLGNVGFMATENVADVFGVALDIATALRTRERTVFMPDIIGQARGLVQGFKEGYEESLLGINLRTGEASKFTLPRGGVFDKSVIGSFFEKVLHVSLGATDRAFYQAAFNQSIRNQMLSAVKRGDKVEEPTEDMIEKAHLFGLYRTFQDDNVLSRQFVGLKKWFNMNRGWGVGDMVIKYPKTPANIMMRGIEYSPFGFWKTVSKFVRALAGKEKFEQEEFVRATSRAFTGSVLMVGVGALLAGIGIITGKHPKDRDEAATRDAAGIKDYQINVSALKRFVSSGMDPELAKMREGDTLMSYDWFLPNSIGVAMGANMVLEPKSNVTDKVLNMGDRMLQASETLQEQPLVRGVKVVTRRQNIAEGLGDVLKDIPASFVPTLLNQVRQLADNTSRNTRDPNYFKEVYNRAIMRVPVLSGTLPARVTPLGKEKQMYQFGTNNPFNVFINPAFVTKYQPDPVTKMVLDLWETTGQRIQFPRVALTKIDLGPENIELTPDQYTDFQTYIGYKTDILFTALSDDPVFLALPDDEKASKLQTYLTRIYQAGKIDVLGYRPAKVPKGTIEILTEVGKTFQELKAEGSVKDEPLRAVDDEEIRAVEDVPDDDIRAIDE